MISFKRITGIVLAVLVLFLTVLSVLSIWGILDLDVKSIVSKSLYSLCIIFVGTILLLFIFSVLVKNEDNTRPPSINP